MHDLFFLNFSIEQYFFNFSIWHNAAKIINEVAIRQFMDK